MTGNYYLANDIDLYGLEFIGIGNENNYFSGNFDGKGYKVINWSRNFTSDNKNYYGLFNYSGGVVKNVGLINYNLEIAIKVEPSVYVAP